MITKEEILQAVSELKMPKTWHSWLKLPEGHSFATWDIPEENFDGSDESAEYKRLTMRVTLFFRGNKEAADFETENRLEEQFRPAGRFSKVTGFDSDNNLFYTQYSFELCEFIN